MKVAQALVEVMDQHPRLTNHGFGIYRDPKDSAEDRSRKLEEGRRALAGDAERVGKIVDWLNQNVKTIKSINTRQSSYGLKHLAEDDIGYVTNGAFIAACLILNVPTRPAPPNAYFGISERSIKALDARRR